VKQWWAIRRCGEAENEGGWREDVWLAGEVMLGERCQMARRVVGAGGRMCG
jgi:hypothetical protein